MRSSVGTTPSEAERLAAVRRYDILDTPPDGAFDRVTALAARYCGVPISTITIVDQDRIWFKSTFGIDVAQIDRSPGLCASAIMEDVPHIVTDATIDPRTLNNPLVRGELGLRFYVGVPLRTSDGHNLGTLNVIDVEPRSPTTDELATLDDLAAVVMDELELRLAARRTIDLEALKEAARFRDAIAAGISHEMRTPLAVLQGIANIDPEGSEFAELQTLMRRQVRHLDWLVRQFLDYARLESERPPAVVVAPFDVQEVVGEAVDLFAHRAPITVDIDEGVPGALADRDRTQQILIELVNNAIRFSPSGEPVVVALAGHGDGAVQVTVSDRGPGIDRADHDRVFDKFHRGAGSAGTGLGLHVARVLAEAQGGSIELDSAPGQGSRFTLVLPTA